MRNIIMGNDNERVKRADILRKGSDLETCLTAVKKEGEGRRIE